MDIDTMMIGSACIGFLAGILVGFVLLERIADAEVGTCAHCGFASDPVGDPD